MWFIIVVLASTGQHILLSTIGLPGSVGFPGHAGFHNSWTCEAMAEEIVKAVPDKFRDAYCVLREDKKHDHP